MSVSRETKTSAYIDLLVRWSRAVSLSSAGDSDAAGFRAHVQDSLALVPYLPNSLDRLIDMGSGQGFPAVPLAIETGIRIDLIEADRRKAAFLTTALATLGLQGNVFATRIERANLPPARCVTARALAPLSRLLTLAHPLVTPDGCCLFLKGPTIREELATAVKLRDFIYRLVPSPSSRSVIAVITKLH